MRKTDIVLSELQSAWKLAFIDIVASFQKRWTTRHLTTGKRQAGVMNHYVGEVCQKTD